MKKSFFSSTRSLFVCLALLFALTVPTEASTSGHTQAEAVAWANSQVGQSLDYDGAYGAQCVDLTCYYYVYLGQAVPWGNANEYANGGHFTPAGWSYQSSPQPGDIAVDSSYSPGHVGIVTEVSGDSLVCVEQQYNSHAYCERVSRSISAHQYNTFIRPDFSTATLNSSSADIGFDTLEPANSITNTSARCGVWCSNPSGATISSVGFCYGTSPDEMRQIEVTNNVGWTRFYLDYNLSDYAGTLDGGTTYFYKFYVSSNGATVYSDVGSFTTSGVSFDALDSVTQLSDTSASCGVWCSNPTGAFLSSIGFFYGTSSSDMHQVEVTKNVSWTRFHLDYTLSDYIDALNPGTTYYYKFYVYSAGDMNYSATGSFKTTGQATVPVKSVSINKNSISLQEKSNVTLSATISPSNATDKTVIWNSSNPSVATVNNGNVTAVGAGTATITVTAGGKSASCTVSVSAATAATVPVASVTLNQAALSLKSGAGVALTATVNPSNATDKAVTWSSSNTSVATVNNGNVTAVGAGTTTITAIAGGKSATCAVTVSAATVPVTGVTLSKTTLSLNSGAGATLTATINPSNATDKAVTWSSSNPSVATVNNGNVIAVGAGSATITATAGGKSASCAVTVEQKTGLQIGTASLSPAVVGASYHQRLVANSAEAVTWSVSSGSLPTGLALSNGVISGTPTKAGSYSFTVTAANNAGTDSKTYTLTVNGNESAPKTDVHFERKNVYHQDQFSDVKANQWFTNTVASAFELGLMKGNSATTFNPYGDVTVAEAITMAARVHSINTTGRENFVQSGNWYQVYLDYAYQNGIISYAYYNSNVTQKATRAQFAEIFAASLPAQNLSAINQIADNAVPDVKMSENYAGSVYTLYRAGILTGSDATGRFNPQTYITRAEAATILSRLAESDNRVRFSLGG